MDPPLATDEQLIARAPEALPSGARMSAILTDVSAAVRAYTGQYFTRVESTDRLVIERGTVRLPQRPVHEVTDVTNVAGEVLAFEWNGLDRVTVDIWPVVTFVAVPVDVTYDHGYDETPDDIVAVVCNITARALGTAPEDAGLTGRTITNYAETFGPIGASGPFGLFADEANILDRYRRHAGIVWTS